jgi:hypothetical protein
MSNRALHRLALGDTRQTSCTLIKEEKSLESLTIRIDSQPSS